MDESTKKPTLEVEGFTPYAQVPRWVIRSGDALSHGAVRLYGVIMTYADNSTKTAFPSREAIAQDMGASVASVKRYIKELEEFHALTVTRRRNKKTGNFYSNHYKLAFANPWVTNDPRPRSTTDPVTTPNITTPTQPSFTPNSDESGANFHGHADAKPRAGGITRGGMSADQRKDARSMLQKAGTLMNDGWNFHSEPVQEAWDDFCAHMEESTQEWEHHDQLIDMLDNGKWTVSAKVADPYEAGKELNKMLNTAKVSP